MARPSKPDGRLDRCLENPVAWFVELALAVDRGDAPQVAKAQDKLRRLGWAITPRPEPAGPPGRPLAGAT
jgi:hypothetical protein